MLQSGRRLSFIWKILLVVGLIILSILSYNLEAQFKEIAERTFNTLPFLSVKPVISIVFGMYLSILVVKKWSFHVNHSLLWCVTVPCAILSFGYPILAALSTFEFLAQGSPNMTVIFWLLKVSSSSALGIVAGFTFMLSFFGTTITEEQST